MKRLLLAFSLFFTIPVSAAEITSKITDSVQLKVDGPALQSTRIGSSYSASGSNVNVTSLGGLTGSSTTAPATINAGSYTINTNGSAFTFSETSLVGDVVNTNQSSLNVNGRWESPIHYGDTITNSGGTAGSLAGSLSGTGVPTVTAGGPGTTATGQRSVELSVFK